MNGTLPGRATTTSNGSTARIAFQKLSSMIRQSAARIDHSDLLEEVHRSMHGVIQVLEGRWTGKRGIVQTWFPALDSTGVPQM